MYDVAALHPGDVILVEGSGTVLDRLISWSTVSVFDHALIVGNGTLVEASRKVQQAPLDKYVARGWVFTVDCTPEQRAVAVARGLALLGSPYGTRELLLDAERFDLHRLPRAPRALTRWTCSGFVCECYRAAGVRLTLAPYPAPSDLSYTPVLIGRRPWEAAA